MKGIWLPHKLYVAMPVVWLFLSLVVLESPVHPWLKWVTCPLLIIHSLMCIYHRLSYMEDVEI